MQDRFKFRVWNKITKEYLYEIKDYSIMLSLNGDIHAIARPYTHKKDIFNFNWDGSLIIEQCTGLKDKNGTLIYEGDIVKKYTFIDYDGQGCEPDKYLDKVDIGIVYITASKGVVLRRVKTLLTENPYKEKELLRKEKRYKATRLVASRSEVIGNIHENPELLER